MYYFLLHLTSLVPILAKVLVAPWGLKVSWLIYLFFTYVLLEHKPFNGHPSPGICKPAATGRMLFNWVSFCSTLDFADACTVYFLAPDKGKRN